MAMLNISPASSTEKVGLQLQVPETQSILASLF